MTNCQDNKSSIIVSTVHLITEIVVEQWSLQHAHDQQCKQQETQHSWSSWRLLRTRPTMSLSAWKNQAKFIIYQLPVFTIIHICIYLSLQESWQASMQIHRVCTASARIATNLCHKGSGGAQRQPRSQLIEVLSRSENNTWKNSCPKEGHSKR